VFPTVQAQTKIEQIFQDPITNKSGKYTVKFSARAAAKSQGLLAFFHGSGNTSGYAGVFDALEAVAKEFNLVPLAIQAPNNAITWPDKAIGPSNQHVAYVKSLLERVIFNAHPEMAKDRSIFVGFSAGSTFLSGDFLPAQIDQFKGGAILLCGGGGPVAQSPSIYQVLPPTIAQNFRFHVYIQKNDFLLGQTTQGVSYWKSRGAQVSFETPDGGGHCAFDFAKELQRAMGIVLNRRG